MSGRRGGYQLIAGWTAGGMGAFAWLLTELADRLHSQLIALLALIPTLIGFVALMGLTVWAVSEIAMNTGRTRTEPPKEEGEDNNHS